MRMLLLLLLCCHPPLRPVHRHAQFHSLHGQLVPNQPCFMRTTTPYPEASHNGVIHLPLIQEACQRLLAIMCRGMLNRRVIIGGLFCSLSLVLQLQSSDCSQGLFRSLSLPGCSTHREASLGGASDTRASRHISKLSQLAAMLGATFNRFGVMPLYSPFMPSSFRIVWNAWPMELYW